MRSMLLAFAVGFALSFASLGAQAQTGTGQVVGRVIDADSKAPIAGARITMFPADRPASAAPFTPLMSTTDDNGRFTFEGVLPGRFRLSAQKQGFAFEPTDAPMVELRAGQAAAVDLSLRRGGVLTGRVLDDRGEPVSDIRVMALRRVEGRDQPSMGSGGPGMMTNDVGEFRLAGLLPGDYVLMASRQPSPSSTGGGTAWATTFYPGTSTRAEAQTIALAQGDTVNGLEFRLIPSAAYRVSGVVVDDSGKPVADAMITLHPRGSDTPVFAPPVYGRANPDGSFVIGAVVPGTYAVSVTRVMRSGAVVSATMVAVGSNISLPQDQQQIVVDAADVSGLKVIAPTPRQ